jgi:hypothetical protein
MLFGLWRHRRPDCVHRPQCRVLRYAEMAEMIAAVIATIQ